MCGPARACLQTGTYATEVGCHTNYRRLPADEQTIAHLLGAHGYDTAYIGKWHLASEKDGDDDFRTRAVPPDRRGGYDYWPDDVFVQISQSHCGRAIRTHKWKYSVRAPDKPGDAPSSDLYVEDFLYDLESDPHERNNLVRDPAYAEVRSELAQRLKQRMVQAGEQAPEIRGPEWP